MPFTAADTCPVNGWLLSVIYDTDAWWRSSPGDGIILSVRIRSERMLPRDCTNGHSADYLMGQLGLRLEKYTVMRK